MSQRITRRRFVEATAAAAAFPLILPRSVRGANETVTVAAIGSGGKGEVDVNGAASCGTNVAALCDIDDKNAAKTFKKYPDARRYRDFRKMLEEMGKTIDAVTVSTADHTHAFAAIMAMRMGKHVYCQKPLTHSVWEARRMREVAREMKVATQMGNQGHSDNDTRRLVELIRAGILGKVSEIHVWTDRPIWPQGIDRPKESEPVPEHLDWDLFLGPAPERPYHSCYTPFKWRGWWDFGTGALGDMGCHNLDLPFFALGLRDPASVEAESSGVNEETAPKWSIVTYNFPELDGRAACKLVWYDGGKLPNAELVNGQKIPKNGVIMVGDKDTLFVPMFWGRGDFLKAGKMEDLKDVPQSLPRAPGKFDKGHYQEWVDACKGGPPALSHFDYAGPMCEAMLLGNVALRAGKKIEWDARALKCTNAPEADRFVKREYRKGWSI
jgi:predicted dehydrogenase